MQASSIVAVLGVESMDDAGGLSSRLSGTLGLACVCEQVHAVLMSTPAAGTRATVTMMCCITIRIPMTHRSCGTCITQAFRSSSRSPANCF